jgi:uncharacterized protein
MNPVGWIAVLTASLLGSLHCAVMCGPLLALYRGGPVGQRWRAFLLHQLGRLAGYLALGAVAGSVGGLLERAGAIVAVQRAAMLLAALALAVWGGVLAVRAWRGVSRHHGAPSVAAPLGRWVRRGLVPLGRRSPAQRALGLGALNALLPCGWLWAFVTLAAGTGAASRGALAMAVFWLGTVPALLGVHALAGAALQRLRPRWPLVTAALVWSLAGAALLLRAPLLDDDAAAASAVCHHGAAPLLPVALEPSR